MEEKLYNEIRQLLRKGMSYKDIALEMELTESIVRRVAKSIKDTNYYYENGNPIFKIFGNNYNGYYNVNFSASVSSATPGVVAIGLYEDGVLIPDTVREVTIAAADDYETISFNRKLKVCPRGNTSITVGSVASVPTPSTPATPIVTQIPIITNATFNLSRSNT